MRISDWSSDVCSSDLHHGAEAERHEFHERALRVPGSFQLAAHADAIAFRQRYLGDLGPNLTKEPARRTVHAFAGNRNRSEEHTSELQSLMRISYAVFCLKKKKKKTTVLEAIYLYKK